MEATQTVSRKADKSKVFYLVKIDDYKVKTQAYMTKTKAYQDLDTKNVLESLVDRTISILLGLLVKKHITQQQYDKLKVKKEKVESAHLYVLPKAHKSKTLLRLIMSSATSL